MSRLHAQKRRVRALQRAEGIIAPDADQIDRQALEELGTAHSQIQAAEDSPLEVERENVQPVDADTVPPPRRTLSVPKKTKPKKSAKR